MLHSLTRHGCPESSRRLWWDVKGLCAQRIQYSTWMDMIWRKLHGGILTGSLAGGTIGPGRTPERPHPTLFTVRVLYSTLANTTSPKDATLPIWDVLAMTSQSIHFSIYVHLHLLTDRLSRQLPRLCRIEWKSIRTKSFLSRSTLVNQCSSYKPHWSTVFHHYGSCSSCL